MNINRFHIEDDDGFFVVDWAVKVCTAFLWRGLCRTVCHSLNQQKASAFFAAAALACVLVLAVNHSHQHVAD